MMAAKKTIVSTGVWLISAVCVVLLLSASAVSSLRREFQSDKLSEVEVSYFTNSQHNFGLPGKLSERHNNERPTFDVLQLRNDDLSSVFNLAGEASQVWNHLRNEHGIPLFRRRRAVTQVATNESVAEDRTGLLIDFRSKFGNLIGRRFTLTSSSVNPEMFDMSTDGRLQLKAGYSLDYEDASMRSIDFVVQAESTTDTADVYEISATLTVTNVDEPPVFETLPQPYRATIRTNSGTGYTIITLVAKDPEGAAVLYEKTSVNPSTYNDRLELRSVTVGGVRECQLRTLGSANFPEGITITISVTAKDALNNGKETTTSVTVLVGVLAPQFYQSVYHGAMPEKNQPQQTVYKVGTTEELTVRWKTFQPGQVSLSLMNEGGGVSNDFGVEMKSGGNDATAYLLCLTVLDFEAENPKTKALTLTAVQRVGTVDMSSNVSVTVEIQDTNDNPPVFDQSQYLAQEREDISVGQQILTVTARDADTDVNAKIVYSLDNTEDFEIETQIRPDGSSSRNAYVGIIRVKKALDYDRPEGPYYSFQVRATDQGTPALSSTSNVRVTVTNVNDEAPQFTVESGKEYQVLENAPSDKVITQMEAPDKDGDTVTYRFASGSQNNQKFNIQRESGLLRLTSAITANDDRFVLDIVAQDDGSCCGGGNTLSSTVQIFVQVSGVNKEKPNFLTCSSYSPSVDEHSPVGTSVLTVSATDPDRGPNGRVTYFINQPTNVFKINSSSGLITVDSDIDRETDIFKQVTVRGKDGGNPSLEGLCTFRVTINDINDNSPQFDKSRYVANITVDLELRVSFVAVRAYDQDVGNNARITYSLVNDAEGKFGIIAENGFIFLNQQLTQTNEQFSLTVMAKDAGTPARNSTVGVVVNVKTGSSKPPTWDMDYNSRTYTVNESIPQGAPIISDMRCQSNIADTRVEFQLIKEDGTAGSRSQFFSITSTPNSNTVTVHSNGIFDYAVKKEHVVRIRCLNYGPVTLMTEVNPKVMLTDTNNQIPAFEGLTEGRYYPEVQENKDAGSSVMTIVATDRDETDSYSQVTFSITSGMENFSIAAGPQRNTAILSTKRRFDREEVGIYFVTVKAQDGAASVVQGFAPGPNTVSVNIRVKITDVNDNAPYFEQTQYSIEVKENFYIDQTINPAIEVKDLDESDRGRHTYRIVQGNGSPPTFGVRNGLGNLFLLRKLDYENGDKIFNLVMEASDGLFSTTTNVRVTVLDVNDNNPVFNPFTYIVSNITENDNNVPKLILSLTATDADVDRPNDIHYSLQGSSFEVSRFFSIDEQTGQLYIIQSLDRDPPEGSPDYQFTVVAEDERQEPNYGYATVSVRPIDVNDNAPQFITDPLEGSVSEHSQIGASVVLVQAEDRDYADNGVVLFFIDNIVDGAGQPRPDYFIIDETQGLVQTNTGPDNLDRETEDTYRLTIMLKDKGTPQQSTQGQLTITLKDINDQSPIFQQKVYTTQMSENLLSGEVIRVVATDADIGDNAKIFYLLSGKNDAVHFSIKGIDNQGSIQVFSPVDYENPLQRFFNLTVEAKDKDGHEDTCYVVIEVLDFNDNAPEIQPKTGTQSISEDAPPGTILTNFTATDRDSGINKEFEFSISRASDPKLQFSIDPVTGVVRTRRKLDRETVALHELIIQAIDKGSPPLTGTATLSVVVEDVNDNYPTFKEDYHPHVLEEEQNGIQRVVQEILAKDPDAPPFGAPFGFQLTSCPGGGCPCSEKPTCEQFQFQFNPSRDGGNGTATISTNRQFDRERQKYYLIPIIMWDMRNTGRSESMTGTNTLTVTIADINDNDMRPGRQDMFVYNYKGMFGPLDIGRVYVEDLDDWDLPDKTFTFNGPAWMGNYFSVASDTGMVTMQKGVPSNTEDSPYVFTVKVEDRKFRSTVISTVSVVIHDLPEEAVRNSGAVRLKGTSAEAFIKVPATSSGASSKSQYEEFQQLLASKLNTGTENVEIISVQDVEGGYTDVRYSAHGSPYYPSSQTDSIIVLNKAEFEQKVGVSIAEVPIDACAEEVFEGGCYNYMDITGRPALVNSNGTSFVGVEVFIRATEGCRALDFPEPNECSGDYCYHGGTCVKDDFGVLSCVNCPEGFEGPRCQQLRHSFDGKSYALYPTLEQCEDSETSIEFITTQADGLLLYNGPMSDLTEDQPRDFIALELSGGLPVLNIDHGSGATTLSLDGRDLNGNQVISSLSDGQWHKIEIIRKGKLVEIIVDDCKVAAQSGSEGVLPDTRPCRASGRTPGENSFLNVATLLQVGGRATSPTYPPSGVVAGAHFDGCVRNLIHNSKYYDLHYKATPEVPSGENGCPREDEICGGTCGANGICTASFSPRRATCVCKPGWRGSSCSVATTIRDLQTSSYIQWQLKSSSLPSHKLEIQVMYRTWDTDGVLFTISKQDNSKGVTLELKDGRLQALYNLGDGQKTLLLNNSQASNGQWHVARFTRMMHRAVLTLDAGEGRNYASQRADLGDNVYMTVDVNSLMFAGAFTTNPQGTEVIDRDLTNTCIQDIRLDNAWMPMKSSENSPSYVADHVREKNVVDGCTRPDGCVPPPVCPPDTVCFPLWGKHECRCAPGYHENTAGQCTTDCDPNPCFQNALCQINNGSVVCDCAPLKPWYGQFCNLYPKENDNEPVVGIAGGTIAAIVVAVVLVLILALLAFLLVAWYKRQKGVDDDEKFVDDDGDFDIRENVMFYDEEGAGEEDQNAYDLGKLPNPVSDPISGPGSMPRRTEMPRGRSVPDDTPDVGDVLNDRLGDAEDDPEAPPFDTLISFADEGAGSDAGSLSSLGSSSSDASQDYDYLNDWGPKFAKLADMYGAGQEPE